MRRKNWLDKIIGDLLTDADGSSVFQFTGQCLSFQKPSTQRFIKAAKNFLAKENPEIINLKKKKMVYFIKQVIILDCYGLSKSTFIKRQDIKIEKQKLARTPKELL